MTLDPLASRALERAHEAVKEAPDSPEARARHVAAIQNAMLAAPAPRRRPIVRSFALAAGLGALLAAGLALRAQPAARVVSQDGTFSSGHTFAAGARIESGTAGLALELSDGTTLTLSSQSKVRLGATATEVHVERGEVAAEVAPREVPFTLQCADAQVFTRGARLKVSPGAGCDGRALVQVLDGEASVSDGTVLRANDAWPRCPAAVRLIPPPVPTQNTAPIPPSPPTARVKKDTAKATAPESPREREARLARLNGLYFEAVSLQRSGKTEEALASLEEVVRDESSALAETALAQKMRWLAPTRREAAREAAQAYLRRFPMGFARAEAEHLVLDP